MFNFHDCVRDFFESLSNQLIPLDLWSCLLFRCKGTLLEEAGFLEENTKERMMRYMLSLDKSRSLDLLEVLELESFWT